MHSRSALAPTLRRALFILCGLILAAAGPSAARADIFHLASGGTVEGELLGQEDGCYRIRTPRGIVSFPVSAVRSIEPAKSPFAEYEERRRATAEDADAQFDLANWCEQRGLLAERRAHLQRAIELDSNHVAARRALGYVRINGIWVEGRTAAKAGEDTRKSEKSEKNDKSEKGEKADKRSGREPLDETQRQWLMRIKSIRSSYLDDPGLGHVDDGMAKIREISDPAAIIPLAQALGRGSVNCRELLIEMLSRFAQDDATLNLAVLALVDPNELLRRKAVAELAKRNDLRVAAQFRRALQSDNDSVIRRAAEGLGTLHTREAIPELIEVLKVQQTKWVEVPVKRYFTEMPGAFAVTPNIVRTGAGTLITSQRPIIGINDVADDAQNEWRYMSVTVFRTEVLEALKAISGVNYGFDQAEWRLWYQEQQP